MDARPSPLQVRLCAGICRRRWRVRFSQVPRDSARGPAEHMAGAIQQRLPNSSHSASICGRRGGDPRIRSQIVQIEAERARPLVCRGPSLSAEQPRFQQSGLAIGVSQRSERSSEHKIIVCATVDRARTQAEAVAGLWVQSNASQKPRLDRGRYLTDEFVSHRGGWRPGHRRRRMTAAYGCCGQALTRFTGHPRTGPGRQPPRRSLPV